jgi:hypothetical protein
VVYKKVYTPYEQEKKYSDESEFENGGCYTIAQIVNIMEVPNDILIEFEILSDTNGFLPFEKIGVRQYYKLSDIKLLRFESDNSEDCEENI